MTDAEIAALRQSCHTVIAGHKQPSAAQEFAAMAQWCTANGVGHDTYGDGELIQAFEQKIAALLGFGKRRPGSGAACRKSPPASIPLTSRSTRA